MLSFAIFKQTADARAASADGVATMGQHFPQEAQSRRLRHYGANQRKMLAFLCNARQNTSDEATAIRDWKTKQLPNEPSKKSGSTDMQRSVHLNSFELFARDINDVDVELLHALTIAVRWPHRQKDWEFLRRVGQGIAAVDGIGRVFGSAMWFPHGDDFATIGLVITTPRTQALGGGRWLMNQVLERCGKRNLALNSTHAAYPLYLSLGFTSEAVVHMHQGEVRPSPPPLPGLDGELQKISRDRIAELTSLDAYAFGVNRAGLLAALAETSSIAVLSRGGEIVGYSMSREYGRGLQVGPVVARNDCDAAHLTAAHLRDLTGRFVRVDTRERGGLFAEFLEASGLAFFETVTTMSKGRRLPGRETDMPWIYGLASHAVG